MRVLLVSTYELGHQPLHVASPAAALRDGGHEVRCVDTSVQRLDAAAVDWAEAMGVSVPMHTAMRLALPLVEQVKSRRPRLPVCLYGLYAPVSRDRTAGRLVDRTIAGEYEAALRVWVDGLDDDPTTVTTAAHGSSRPGDDVISLARDSFSLPARDLLPPLDRYAHLSLAGEHRPVGYTEATHGCLLECRHCPVPTVYGGRFRAASRDLVLDDIAQLVDMGARHITFGDPDFLNGPTHSERIVTAIHERWPHVTFDCTAKVDHILDHADLWETFAASGCVFVVSAFETLNDEILKRLDKGHTATQASEVVDLLRDHGIEVRPSWLPFTPWTSVADVLDILEFVITHDLVGNVDPVQYTIRLLIPEGSLLLDHPDLEPHLGSYDPDGLTYTWESDDPAVDDLQTRLTDVVESGTAAESSNLEVFLDVNAAVREAAGRSPRDSGLVDAIPPGATEGRPRLTEPWFC